jgi:tight adherence protein B
MKLAERSELVGEPAADNYFYETSSPLPEENLASLLQLELRLQSGAGSRSVLTGLDWKDDVLAQQLRFGIACGIPLSPLITWLRAEFQHAQQQKRRVELALRNPVLTARIVHWLPWASLAGAQAMGLPAISILVLQPAGWAVIAGALVLNVFSVRLTRRIIRAAALVPESFAWQYRLLAMAVRSGVGVRAALAELREVCLSLDAQLPGWMNNAFATGLPLAGMLELQAATIETRIEQQGNLLAEELPVKLLLPMALFLLPQFMLLLVVPQVLAAFGLFR